jgi:hypothetical protein
MFALLRFFLALFSSLFKSKSRLEAENAALRRQLIALQRKVRGRVHFTNSDRLFLIQLYRWFPSVLSLGGRPQIEADLRALIRRLSVDNPLWGAPRIHGELLKLGFEVAQSSIATQEGAPGLGRRSMSLDHRDLPRLIFREKLAADRRSEFALIIDVCELLPVMISHDEIV